MTQYNEAETAFILGNHGARARAIVLEEWQCSPDDVVKCTGAFEAAVERVAVALMEVAR